jgi:hypothetical protein
MVVKLEGVKNQKPLAEDISKYQCPYVDMQSAPYPYSGVLLYSNLNCS